MTADVCVALVTSGAAGWRHPAPPVHHGGVSVPTGQDEAEGPVSTTAPAQNEAAQNEAARRRERLRANAADMLRSLAVVLAIVLVVFFLVPRPSATPTGPADLPGAAAAARVQLGFEPAVGVPQGWTVTATKVRRDTGDLAAWSVNYLTPSGHYVGLEQVAGWTKAWQDSLTHGGKPEGTQSIAGNEWSVYYMAEREIRTWLLRTEGRSLLVLVKAGTPQDGTTLIQSLRSGV